MKMKIELIEHDFSGDLFIDVGGNIGMWSKILYPYFKNIIFIEPSEEAISTAKLNINDYLNKIEFLKNICSDTNGIKKSIYSCTNDTGNFSVYGKELYQNIQKNEKDIDTLTIDSLIDLKSVKNSNEILIKIDTEGSDLDILLGSLNFIKLKKPTIIVETHFHMNYDVNKYETIIKFLKENNYVINEYKNSDYLSQKYRIFDGKHNGEQMYNLHYQMLIKNINNDNK